MRSGFWMMGARGILVNRTAWMPSKIPRGHPRMDKATLVNGLLLALIRFLAARKLIGTAIRVPIAVARRAMNTVSMIFSQVAIAVRVSLGPLTRVLIVARICWASATGCRIGSSASSRKYPSLSVKKSPSGFLTPLFVMKLMGPLELGGRL